MNFQRKIFFSYFILLLCRNMKLKEANSEAIQKLHTQLEEGVGPLKISRFSLMQLFFVTTDTASCATIQKLE